MKSAGEELPVGRFIACFDEVRLGWAAVEISVEYIVDFNTRDADGTSDSMNRLSVGAGVIRVFQPCKANLNMGDQICVPTLSFDPDWKAINFKIR